MAKRTADPVRAAKVPFPNRRILAQQLGLPDDAIRMVENDVGGGFGCAASSIRKIS